jgi:hypothetical protein
MLINELMIQQLLEIWDNKSLMLIQECVQFLYFE